MSADTAGSGIAKSRSHLTHRRSMSLPEGIEKLVLGDLPPVKPKNKSKLPSLGSLLASKLSNKSSASRDSFRSSEKVNSSSGMSASGNPEPSYVTERERNGNAADPSLPKQFKGWEKTNESKFRDRSKQQKQPKMEINVALFPWRQKKQTNAADLEQCFDFKASRLSPPSSSSKKLFQVPFADDEVVETNKATMREKRNLRKSVSLNDLRHKDQPGSIFSREEIPFHTLHSLTQPRPFSAPVKNTGQLHIMRYKGVLFLNEYALICTLGRGSFGKVKLALSTLDSELYALKLMPKAKTRLSRSSRSRETGEDIQREIDVMKSLNHPNVIRLIEVIDDPLNSKMLLVMEYAAGKSLVPSIHAPKPHLTEILARRYFRDVLLGLDYLHANNVAHGDLKPENLLTNADGSVKIADLGSSHFAVGPSKKTRGTPAFMAPEMCSNQPFDPMKADLWALGACLYSFVFGRQPFRAESLMGLYDAICSEPLQFPPEIFISDSLKHLLRRLLEKDPSKRIGLLSVMNHQWVTHNGAYLLPNCRNLEPDEVPAVEAWLLESWPLDPADFSFKSLINSIEDILEHRRFKTGECIVKQGDPVREMFYVSEGEVQIVHVVESDSEDDDFEESEFLGPDIHKTLSSSPHSRLKHVFHATKSAHQMLPTNSVKRLERIDLETEGKTVVAQRGQSSILIEAELIEKGLDSIWHTSIIACCDVILSVINLERVKSVIIKHPELELDIRASVTQRIKELQKLKMLETLARIHSDIEDEVCVNGVCPLWTRIPEAQET